MAKPRKLLFYTHGLTAGGAERVCARLASGFAARGDSVIFAVDFEARENLPFLSANVDLRVLPSGHGRAVRGLARILRDERPAASLSAISVSNGKHIAAAALAGQVGRTILTYHGFYESERQRLSNLIYRLTPLLTRVAGASVAVSEVLRADLIKRFRAPAARVRTIYNPAAPEPFPAPLTPSELAGRPPVILAMGRLAPDKDFVALLRAFARLKRGDARLTLLGEGLERGRLEDEARALGIESRISMPGFLGDVGVEIARARCFVVSSRRESFSLACVEALAHGLPIVATDCGGPTEIINAPALGRIVGVGDVAALAAAIESALADPGDPAARQRRAHDFSLETALDAYDALIRTVSDRT